jgi:hypothetical protein
LGCGRVWGEASFDVETGGKRETSLVDGNEMLDGGGSEVVDGGSAAKAFLVSAALTRHTKTPATANGHRLSAVCSRPAAGTPALVDTIHPFHRPAYLRESVVLSTFDRAKLECFE